MSKEIEPETWERYDNIGPDSALPCFERWKLNIRAVLQGLGVTKEKAAQDWLTQDQRDASLLPHVVDNGQVTVCDSMSGGARQLNGMPRSLSLIRWTPEGVELRADYVQVEGEKRPDTIEKAK